MSERVQEASSDRQAVAIAARVLGWSCTIALLLGAAAFAAASKDLETAMLCLVILGVGGFFAMPFVVFGGELIGWAACRAVGNSTIPARRMSFILSLLLILSIAGWFLAALLEPSL